jgi:hypothetical protein
MMGVGYARNMYSDLQEIIKYCAKCHLVGTFLKLKKKWRRVTPLASRNLKFPVDLWKVCASLNPHTADSFKAATDYDVLATSPKTLQAVPWDFIIGRRRVV